MKTRTLITASFAILMPFCLFLIGCVKPEYDLDSHSFTAQYLDMVQTNIGVTIPAGASGLNMHYQEFHAALRAKIQIPSVSGQAFADQLKRIPAEDFHDDIWPSAKYPWWTPTKPDVIVDRQFARRPDGDFVHLVLCKEKDDGRWILYVIWATV